MRKRMRGAIVLSAGLLAAGLAGCSAAGHEAKAEPAIEAASVEWTEAELKKTSDRADALSNRADKLKAEVSALLASGGEKPKPVFKDVPQDFWAYKEIMYLYSRNMVSGYPATQQFMPGKPITRGQAAAMLVKALKLPLSDAPSAFPDVKNDNSFRKAIMTVTEKGYFGGDKGKFRPNDPMTRKQMALVLTRVFQLKATDAPFADFKDVPSTDDGYLPIKALAQHGITTGSNGYYHPGQATTRAHFSVFLVRGIEKK